MWCSLFSQPFQLSAFCIFIKQRKRFLSFPALVEDLVKTSGRTLSQPQGVRWGLWETWSSCSQQCSRGFRTRKRSCLTAEGRTNPSTCVGSPVEYQDCNTQPCPGKSEDPTISVVAVSEYGRYVTCNMCLPVNGAWSCWSSWSQCSASCGSGHYQRTRTCSNPPPASGGDICIGLHTEEALCNTHTCEGMKACHLYSCIMGRFVLIYN